MGGWNGVGITYDALGRMVEQNRSSVYTEIVYTPSSAKLALMSGSTLQKGFVPLTGGSMAVYNSTGLAHYRHSDWIGSARLASTPSRTIYSDVAYGPFGEAYAQSGGGVDLSFTGMNQDTVPNLYDFPAREYGIQGRWPSPDPGGMAAVDPADPQTWNRYAYVRNSPLTMTDPTGLDPCEGGACDNGGDDICDINELACFGPPGTGPDNPVVTSMGSFGPSRFTPPGSNSIFACNPYQSCPGVYVPPGDIFQWFGFPDCAPVPGIGNPCIMDATESFDPNWWKAFFSSLFSWQNAKQAQIDAWNNGYYKCLAQKNLPGFSAAATTHVAGEVAGETASHFGPQIAGAYYHFTDARFTAWGKYSKVLVPEAAGSIKVWAGRLNAAGWAYADYELAKSIGECSEVLQ